MHSLCWWCLFLFCLIKPWCVDCPGKPKSPCKTVTQVKPIVQADNVGNDAQEKFSGVPNRSAITFKDINRSLEKYANKPPISCNLFENKVVKENSPQTKEDLEKEIVEQANSLNKLLYKSSKVMKNVHQEGKSQSSYNSNGILGARPVQLAKGRGRGRGKLLREQATNLPENQNIPRWSTNT